MAALNVSPGQQNSDRTEIHSGEESNSSPNYWTSDIYHHSSSPSIIVKTRSGITPNNNQVNWINIKKAVIQLLQIFGTSQKSCKVFKTIDCDKTRI